MSPGYLALVLGVFGLVIGSFLALVSVRLPAGEDVVHGRSRCRSCGHDLGVAQLIPVLSYVIGRGRCAFCDARVSWRYPLVELAAAGIGVWAGLSQGAALPVVLTAVLGWQLLLIAIIDAEHYILPDHLTLPLLASGLVANGLVTGGFPWSAMTGVVAGFSALWLIGFAYTRVRGVKGLGGGDPILFAGAGAWVGWRGLPPVLLIACAAGLAFVLLRGALNRKFDPAERMPFGALLAAGIFLVSQTSFLV